MSSVRFIIGGEADIASGDEVRSAVNEGTDRILSRIPNRHRANRRRIPASANNPAATVGTWVMDFGSPQGDFLWWIVEVIVTAADDRAAPAQGVAALYAGTPPRQLTGSTLSDIPLLGSLVRPAVALPAVFTFAKESWPVKDGENLFVIVYSPATALTVMSATATVMEIPASAVSLGFL